MARLQHVAGAISRLRAFEMAAGACAMTGHGPPEVFMLRQVGIQGKLLFEPDKDKKK
jgi:hypothetical protein